MKSVRSAASIHQVGDAPSSSSPLAYTAPADAHDAEASGDSDLTRAPEVLYHLEIAYIGASRLRVWIDEDSDHPLVDVNFHAEVNAIETLDLTRDSLSGVPAGRHRLRWLIEGKQATSIWIRLFEHLPSGRLAKVGVVGVRGETRVEGTPLEFTAPLQRN